MLWAKYGYSSAIIKLCTGLWLIPLQSHYGRLLLVLSDPQPACPHLPFGSSWTSQPSSMRQVSKAVWFLLAVLALGIRDFRGTYENTNWGTFVVLQAQNLNHALQIPTLPTLSFVL